MLKHLIAMRRPMPLAAPVIKTISLLRSFFGKYGMKNLINATKVSHRNFKMNNTISFTNSILIFDSLSRGYLTIA